MVRHAVRLSREGDGRRLAFRADPGRPGRVGTGRTRDLYSVGRVGKWRNVGRGLRRGRDGSVKFLEVGVVREMFDALSGLVFRIERL